MLKTTLLFITVLCCSHQIECRGVTSSNALGRPLSAAATQRQALLTAAHTVLSDTRNPKEMSAVASFLTNSRFRSSALRRGSKAWCPLLELNSTGYPREPNPLSLALAVNSVYVMKNMTWDAAMSDHLAAVAVAGIWWSSKSRPVPVTLITQATVDRLPQLYSQCKSWRGPLSAVIYIGLFQDNVSALTSANLALLTNASRAVNDLFGDVDNDETACKLDVMLVYEVYVEIRAMMLYPINVLRNLARAQARTPVLALVDVDMLLGSRLYQDLRTDPSFAQQLIKGADARTAYVMPAFETYGQTYEAAALADLLASKDKTLLHESVRKQLAGPFDHARFPQGHNWTLFDRWYGATQAYNIVYGARFEPWTIVSRKAAPWHDTRFRGYGQNKIVHIADMNSTGFQFVVLSNAYIIHRCHEKTTARITMVASKTVYDTAVAAKKPVDTTDVYGHTRDMFDKAQISMASGSYKPVLDVATANCMHELSWW